MWGVNMRLFILLALAFLAGCASNAELNGIDSAIEDSRQAFNRAIPPEWNIDNYSDRVVDDYISRGGNGFLATDITGRITSFHMCDGYSNKKCMEFAANEAKGQCENTVALAIVYGFIPSQPTECKVVVYKNRILTSTPFVYRGKIYSRQEKLF